MEDSREDIHTSLESPPSPSRTLSIWEREQTMKANLLRKIREKNNRVTALIAKKKQENDKRKKEREAEDHHKKEFIEMIKKNKELKRQQTMKKIKEKLRRAEELLREKEELAAHGRQPTEIRESLVLQRRSPTYGRVFSNGELGRKAAPANIQDKRSQSQQVGVLRKQMSSGSYSTYKKSSFSHDIMDDSVDFEDEGGMWENENLETQAAIIEEDREDNENPYDQLESTVAIEGVPIHEGVSNNNGERSSKVKREGEVEYFEDLTFEDEKKSFGIEIEGEVVSCEGSFLEYDNRSSQIIERERVASYEDLNLNDDRRSSQIERERAASCGDLTTTHHVTSDEIITTILDRAGPQQEDIEEVENKIIELEEMVQAQNATIEELRSLVLSWRLKAILIVLATAFVANQASRTKDSRLTTTDSLEKLSTMLSICFDSQLGLLK